MTELHSVALIPAKAGSEDIVRDVLRTLAAATQSHTGCRHYELFESAAVPGMFVTIETWDSQADLDAHMATEDIATAFAAADGHLSGDVALHPLTPVTG